MWTTCWPRSDWGRFKLGQFKLARFKLAKFKSSRPPEIGSDQGAVTCWLTSSAAPSGLPWSSTVLNPGRWRAGFQTPAPPGRSIVAPGSTAPAAQAGFCRSGPSAAPGLCGFFEFVDGDDSDPAAELLPDAGPSLRLLVGGGLLIVDADPAIADPADLTDPKVIPRLVVDVFVQSLLPRTGLAKDCQWQVYGPRN